MDLLKLLAFLYIPTCLLTINTYGQQTSSPRISLSETNTPLEKILDILEKKIGYTHFGETRWTQYAKPVTISVKDRPIEEVLDICFKDQPLEYYLDGTQINIRIKGGQSISVIVSGKIVNDKNEPVAGASIRVKGSQQGTTSKHTG